ncbi:unnamed protein product [Ilex paraguariensis]|uniref:Uncharacterized protein n=1 Tax=Ilex paraguariensis TaxID=185542 RepID=A0ABC8QT18_9AQUA
MTFLVETFVSEYWMFSISSLSSRIDPRELYEKYDLGNDQELLPHTNRLRFLEKVAILTQLQTIEEQENQKWRLCRITEVEETKIFFRMIPMLMPFVICGIVSSVRTSFFLEQAMSITHRFRFLTFSFLIFFYASSMYISASIYALIAIIRRIFGMVKQKHIPIIGIGFGIMISIFCCIVVALVEQTRLTVAKGHGLINVPQSTIPMSIFWLIPQFVLLGAPQGILLSNMTHFLVNHVPNSMQSYLSKLTEAFLGVGFIASVLTVNVVGKISDERGGESWFRETLNKSQLDKYYYTLPTMSCANLFFYPLVASWFNYKEVHIPTEEQEVVDEERFQYHEE